MIGATRPIPPRSGSHPGVIEAGHLKSLRPPSETTVVQELTEAVVSLRSKSKSRLRNQTTPGLHARLRRTEVRPPPG